MERHAPNDKGVLTVIRSQRVPYEPIGQRASSNLASRVEYMNTFRHLEKKESDTQK